MRAGTLSRRQVEYLKKHVTAAGGVRTSPQRHVKMQSRWRKRALLHSPPLAERYLLGRASPPPANDTRSHGRESCRWDALALKVRSRSPAAIRWGRREHVEWAGLAWRQCTVYHAAVGAHLIDCLQEKSHFRHLQLFPAVGTIWNWTFSLSHPYPFWPDMPNLLD